MPAIPPSIIIAKLRSRIKHMTAMLEASREKEKATKKLLLQAARAHDHFGGESLYDLRSSEVGPEFGRMFPELDTWLSETDVWKD